MRLNVLRDASEQGERADQGAAPENATETAGCACAAHTRTKAGTKTANTQDWTDDVPVQSTVPDRARYSPDSMRRHPGDVADRLAPADPRMIPCLTCAHYVEVGHNDTNAAPYPWIAIIRLCSAIIYNDGFMEWTDEAFAFCNQYRPTLLALLTGRSIWWRNRRLLIDAGITLARRGVEQEEEDTHE